MIWIAAAHAATLEVGPDAAYPSFADALVVAVSGDTVSFTAGTHVVCADTGGRSLTLTGAVGAVLDAQGCGPVLTVQYGEHVTIRGLTLQNSGQRLLTVTWSTLTLEDVVLVGGGNSTDYGGALYAYGATVTTSGVVAQDNEAAYGGAFFFDAYNVWNDVGSTFTGNSAGNGGAVFSNWDNDVSLYQTRFDTNTAGYGGGVTLSWYGAATFTDVAFAGNSATTNGGGLYVYALDELLTITGASFTDNSAGQYGGAIEVEWYPEVVIEDSEFTGNSAAGAGGAGFVYVADRVTVRRSLFCGNAAPAGGAWANQWLTDDTWTNNRFVENTATQGGALHRYATYAGTFQHNTLVGNTADQGAGLFHSYAWSEVNHNIFADSAGVAVWTAEGQTHTHTPLTYDGWSANTVDAGGYSWADPASGNVWGDPLFVSAEGCGADLRLASGSPMRDAGAADCVDLDGSVCDLGAYGGTDVPLVDADGDGATTDTDCDDTNAAVHPAGTESCNGLDDDCDGTVDGETPDAPAWYADADGDGVGAGAAVVVCDAPEGHAATDGDCDDTDADTFPGAAEIIADGVDQDCDGADTPLEAPVEETPTEDEGCGCATGSGAPMWGVAIALMALRRRRGGGAGLRPRRPGSVGIGTLSARALA